MKTREHDPACYAEALRLSSEVVFVPLVTTVGITHQFQAHVVAHRNDSCQGIDGQVLTLPRAESTDERKAKRADKPWGRWRSSESKSVIREDRPAPDAAQAVLQELARRFRVDNDGVGECHRKQQSRGDEPGQSGLEFMNVTYRRHTGNTGCQQPVGNRDRTYV